MLTAASASADDHGGRGPASAAGPAFTVGTAGSARTIASGDAVRRKKEAGPAQRQAAQSASSTRPGGGPQPSHDFSGSRSTPGGGSTASSTTQPRTLRPCNGMRTRVPTTTSSVHPAGTA